VYFSATSAPSYIDPTTLNPTSFGLAVSTTTNPVIYYVVNPTTNTFQLALTSGGAALDINGAGSGVVVYPAYGSFKLTATRGTTSGTGSLGSALDLSSAGTAVTVTPLDWSRLFLTGESVRFYATSITNWQVFTDGRIPNTCRLGRTSAQTITHNLITNVAINTNEYDNADLARIGVTIYGVTADAIRLRRRNKYLITAGFRFTVISAAINRFAVWFPDNAMPQAIYQFAEATAGSGSAPGQSLVTTAELPANLQLYLRVFQNSGANQSTSNFPYPHLAVTEVLS
jgi:hypothetical protein